jgi:hypothetical protein
MHTQHTLPSARRMQLTAGAPTRAHRDASRVEVYRACVAIVGNRPRDNRDLQGLREGFHLDTPPGQRGQRRNHTSGRPGKPREASHQPSLLQTASHPIHHNRVAVSVERLHRQKFVPALRNPSRGHVCIHVLRVCDRRHSVTGVSKPRWLPPPAKTELRAAAESFALPVAPPTLPVAVPLPRLATAPTSLHQPLSARVAGSGQRHAGPETATTRRARPVRAATPRSTFGRDPPGTSWRARHRPSGTAGASGTGC